MKTNNLYYHFPPNHSNQFLVRSSLSRKAISVSASISCAFFPGFPLRPARASRRTDGDDNAKTIFSYFRALFFRDSWSPFFWGASTKPSPNYGRAPKDNKKKNGERIRKPTSSSEIEKKVLSDPTKRAFCGTNLEGIWRKAGRYNDAERFAIRLNSPARKTAPKNENGFVVCSASMMASYKADLGGSTIRKQGLDLTGST